MPFTSRTAATVRRAALTLGVSGGLLLGALAPAAQAQTPDTHACGLRELPVPDYITGVYNFRAACASHDRCYRS